MTPELQQAFEREREAREALDRATRARDDADAAEVEALRQHARALEAYVTLLQRERFPDLHPDARPG
jgi:hypothetical protein